MIQILLVAHGKLATEMRNTAEMLLGALSNVNAINFMDSDGFDSLSEIIDNELRILDSETLIFTDLFGGTPYNAACSVLLKNKEINAEVISGMSLPLVLETVAMSDKKLEDIASELPKLSAEVVKKFDKHLIEDEEDFL